MKIDRSYDTKTYPISFVKWISHNSEPTREGFCRFNQGTITTPLFETFGLLPFIMSGNPLSRKYINIRAIFFTQYEEVDRKPIPSILSLQLYGVAVSIVE